MDCERDCDTLGDWVTERVCEGDTVPVWVAVCVLVSACERVPVTEPVCDAVRVCDQLGDCVPVCDRVDAGEELCVCVGETAWLAEPV